jgi:hypothetical protein
MSIGSQEIMAEKKEDRKTSMLPGLAIMACIIIGIMGIVLAFATGEGTWLIASAISFGSIVIAAFQ